MPLPVLVLVSVTKRYTMLFSLELYKQEATYFFMKSIVSSETVLTISDKNEIYPVRNDRFRKWMHYCINRI